MSHKTPISSVMEDLTLSFKSGCKMPHFQSMGG